MPEGFVPFRGYRTWYRIIGERRPAPLPLLCLHGGPGSSSSYHSRLEALGDGRQVVRYDQLGCGNSDRPDDDSLWTLELFVSEVQAVRDALGLDRVHVLGTSAIWYCSSRSVACCCAARWTCFVRSRSGSCCSSDQERSACRPS